jgi:hypothetical protein
VAALLVGLGKGRRGSNVDWDVPAHKSAQSCTQITYNNLKTFSNYMTIIFIICNMKMFSHFRNILVPRISRFCSIG